MLHRWSFGVQKRDTHCFGGIRMNRVAVPGGGRVTSHPSAGGNGKDNHRALLRSAVKEPQGQCCPS